jgi:hypothetical protein
VTRALLIVLTAIGLSIAVLVSVAQEPMSGAPRGVSERGREHW